MPSYGVPLPNLPGSPRRTRARPPRGGRALGTLRLRYLLSGCCPAAGRTGCARAAGRAAAGGASAHAAVGIARGADVARAIGRILAGALLVLLGLGRGRRAGVAAARCRARRTGGRVAARRAGRGLGEGGATDQCARGRRGKDDSHCSCSVMNLPARGSQELEPRQNNRRNRCLFRGLTRIRCK